MPHAPLKAPGFPEIIPRAATLDALHRPMLSCTRCALALSRTRVVPGAGDENARVFMVGEAPGANEDRAGIPFVGASGRLLDEMLTGAGIERSRIFIANLVRCRPPENRNPRAAEIQACSGWLAEQIRLVSPTLVVPLGRVALQHFIPRASIVELQGEERVAGYSGQEIRLFPLLHPSAVLRNARLRDSYASHFQRLAALAGRMP